MKKKLFLLALGAIVLAGCNTVKTATVPPGTSASYNVRSAIVENINALQKIYHPDCTSYKITNAQVAGSRDLTVLEEWSVLACGKTILYDIQIIHKPTGQTAFNVTHRE